MRRWLELYGQEISKGKSIHESKQAMPNLYQHDAQTRMILPRTVKGPSPERVSISPTAVTALTRVENLSSPAAISTMFELTEVGVKTVSIVWIMPRKKQEIKYKLFVL